MTKEITHLEISEVSLVDDPANPEAFVEIVKAKNGAKPDATEIIEKMTTFADALARISDRRETQRSMDRLYDRFDALRSSVESIIYDGDMKPDDKKPALTTAFEAFKNEINAFAPPMAVSKSLAEGMSADPEAVAKAAAQVKEIIMDMESMSKALEDAETKLETLTKRASDAEAKLAEQEKVVKAKDAEIATLKGDVAKAKQTDEDVLKELPEPVRKRLEAAEAENKANREAIEKMKADAEEREAIAKAKTIGIGKPEEVGPLLVRVAKGKTTAEDVALVERLLAAAAAQSGDIFKARGGGAAADAGDPEAQMEAKAHEIKKANPKLTFAEAYDQAVSENGKLYQEISKARRAKHPAAA